jgi:SAM-dependent methyltransferase
MGALPSTAMERLPMMKGLGLLHDIMPSMGRTTSRVWYRYLTRWDKQAEMIFMNYGYAETDPAAPALALHESDESDRYCIQLYHHVIAATELADRDVLEVGCGRGGGSSYLARYLNPKSIIGLDIAGAAIEFCNRHHSVAGLSFVQGEAESLPFPDQSFDAVVNIESSHDYCSRERFFSEVSRCLRPGGYLLFADRDERKGMIELRRQLRRSGFDVLRAQNINDNVVRALDLDDDRKLQLIHRGVPRIMRKPFKQFAATKGTSLYRSFQNGTWEYMSFVLQKVTGD